MLRKEVWNELRDDWPSGNAGYWDDWIRQPQQRKGRVCIRPEIARTHTAGKKGTSKGQFWKMLEQLALNDVPVDWFEEDLDYLLEVYSSHHTTSVLTLPFQENFNQEMDAMISEAIPVHAVSEITFQNKSRDFILDINSKNEYTQLAKQLNLIDDF